MAKNHNEPRFDFAPLERVLTLRGELWNQKMAGATVHRYRRQGVPLSSADEWACRLGYHPCELWGDEWLDA